jgi:ABC-type glycerol-3-phosphate transport system substrate-binding protein
MKTGLSVFQVVLMAVFGALAIAAVLIFAFAVGNTGGNAVGAVQIWGTLDQAAFTTVIRQAAEADPSLSQVVYTQKDPATFDRDLTNALASGTGPDLFLLREDHAILDAPKILPIPYENLSATQFGNVWVEAGAPYLSDGGVLGVPMLVDPLVLYWNRDLFASAGLATPPRFWDELSGIAQKITKRTDAGSIEKSAVAFGEYANVDHAKEILAALILQAGGAITARDSTGRLTPALSPRTGETNLATENALRFYTQFADPSKDDYSWSRALPSSREAFSAGDLALYVGYASEQPLLARTNPNLNFAVAQLPQIRGAARLTTTGRVYALAAPRSGKNPTGAVTAAFLLAGSGITRDLSVALGIPSARRDVLALPASGEDDLYNNSAIIARSWLDPDPDETARIFRGMIEDTTTGSARFSDAVQRADQELAQLLGI